MRNPDNKSTSNRKQAVDRFSCSFQSTFLTAIPVAVTDFRGCMPATAWLPSCARNGRLSRDSVSLRLQLAVPCTKRMVRTETVCMISSCARNRRRVSRFAPSCITYAAGSPLHWIQGKSHHVPTQGSSTVSHSCAPQLGPAHWQGTMAYHQRALGHPTVGQPAVQGV